jgi:hypothetical protein
MSCCVHGVLRGGREHAEGVDYTCGHVPLHDLKHHTNLKRPHPPGTHDMLLHWTLTGAACLNLPTQGFVNLVEMACVSVC